MWVGTVMTPWKLCLGALLALAVACGLMALVTMPARAQACAPADEMLNAIANSLNEWPMMVLGRDDGAEVFLTVSPEGGWTLLLMRPDGMACPLIGGHYIRQVPPPKAKGRDS